MSVRTRSLLTVLSVLVLAVSVTWFLVGVRAQVEVGYSCASGGPYEIVAPCPHHTTSLVLVGMFISLVPALAGTLASLSVGAPNLVVPYWTFTLGGLGVLLFISSVQDGWVFGAIVAGTLGVLFGLPGLYLMSPWQRLYRRQPVADAPLSRNQWWLVYLALAAVGFVIGSWTANAWL
jgi:hypothetical protein